MACRSFDVLKMSKPAATARSMKYGSVKLRSIKVLKVPSESPSLRSWPLPSRLRSRIAMSIDAVPRTDGNRSIRESSRKRRFSLLRSTAEC